MRFRGILYFLISILMASIIYAGVANTKHNLSKTGPGTIKSSIEDQVCIFCHIPHNASANGPLWNRNLSTATYQTYNSITMNAQPGQPTGSSKLCLSCHDGTIALNALYTGQTSATDLNYPLTGSANLGTDLTDDHPISFLYQDSISKGDSQLKDITTLPSFIKLQNGRIECTTCHDPHTEIPYFLRIGDKEQLCEGCHDKKTDGNPALLFNNSFHSQVITNAPISSDYGCGNCHKVHNAKDVVNGDTTTQLLKGKEENLCFICHGSRGNLVDAPVPNATGKNIQEVTDTLPGILGSIASSPCNNSTCHGKWTISTKQRYYNKSHDVVQSAQAGNNTHMECINCHGVHGLKKDILTSENNVIESLIDPTNLQTFVASDPQWYKGSSLYWKKFYQMDQYCEKCHSESYPISPGGRNDLTVSTDTDKETINVFSNYSTSIHGSKEIPCMACHDPHSGNYLLLQKNINWNIDGGAPFNTNDAPNTLQTTITGTDLNDTMKSFCYSTCHSGKTFENNFRHHVRFFSSTTQCINCHFHGEGLL